MAKEKSWSFVMKGCRLCTKTFLIVGLIFFIQIIMAGRINLFFLLPKL